jgi:hypothetical protein
LDVLRLAKTNNKKSNGVLFLIKKTRMHSKGKARIQNIKAFWDCGGPSVVFKKLMVDQYQRPQIMCLLLQNRYPLFPEGEPCHVRLKP